jgi:hypothetical protein
MPLNMRRSSVRGTPRGSFGNIGLMTAHSISASTFWSLNTSPAAPASPNGPAVEQPLALGTTFPKE